MTEKEFKEMCLKLDTITELLVLLCMKDRLTEADLDTTLEFIDASIDMQHGYVSPEKTEETQYTQDEHGIIHDKKTGRIIDIRH